MLDDVDVNIDVNITIKQHVEHVCQPRLEIQDIQSWSVTALDGLNVAEDGI